MLFQEVMWTFVPNGLSGDAASRRLHGSIVVSPRLQTDEAQPTNKLLNQYADFVDWPATLATIDLGLQFEGGPLFDNASIQRSAPTPDSKLWRSLFAAATLVKPFRYKNLHARPILSYPLRNVLGRVRKSYEKIALAYPTELPEAVNRSDKNVPLLVRRELEDLRISPETYRAFKRQLRSEIAKRDIKALEAEAPDTQRDFSLARLFFEPKNKANPAFAANADGKQGPILRVPIQQAKYDFHEVVSLLQEYPTVLRILGLVIDISVPWSNAVPVNGRVSIKTSWSGSLQTKNMLPKSAYALDLNAGSFLPRPGAGSDLNKGLLNLGAGSQYEVMQVDVDGAALKLMDFSSNLHRMNARRSGDYRVNNQAGLPAIQSAGLGLARNGLAFRLAQMLMNFNTYHLALKAAVPGDVTLFAEDLQRGYRIDIWDDASKAWHSLCRRRGEYSVDGFESPIPVDHEEGTITLGSTESADDSSPELFLHEMLLRWTGWSLCVERPGKIIGLEDEVAPSSTPKDPDFPLDSSMQVFPKSLPRLRFGWQYRIRARAANIGGGGLTHDEADPNDFGLATALEMYRRFQPVPAPAIVFRALPGKGESLERMVIRSYNDAPDKDEIKSDAASERHVAPPRGSQLLAEHHGRFDGPAGLRKDAYATMIAYDTWFNEVEVVENDADGLPLQDHEGTIHKRKHSLEDAEQLSLPYSSDPLARSVVFRGLPETAPGSLRRIVGAADSSEAIDYNKGLLAVGFGPDDSWPAWLPFRIRLEEGPAEINPPQWDEANRILTVFLAKAETALVDYSCALGQDMAEAEKNLDLMGIWQWMRDGGATPAMRTFALAGLIWALTPYRKLKLVHAVQQPLAEPRVVSITGPKQLGKTFAALQSPEIRMHGKSTGTVDVESFWKTPIDDPAKASWHYLPASAHIKELKPGPEDTKLSLFAKHEFGDTKYRRVGYRAVGTTRFKEFFATSIADEDFRRSQGRDDLTEIDIENSKRPDLPKLLYIVPTYGWESETDGQTISKTRSGGGLRVYLDRPWFSSGDGELLAAILMNSGGGQSGNNKGGSKGGSKAGPQYLQQKVQGLAATLLKTQIPEKLKPYVTQWGLDPVFLSSPTPSDMAPRVNNFRNPSKVGNNLSLAELPDSKVTAVAYQPVFDEERRLWYCDIEMDMGKSYYPFVRLALARYQPISVEDAHLSRVVVADFAQLAPDRHAVLSFDPGNDQLLNLTVHGVSYRANVVAHVSSELEVSVERRIDGATGDLGWQQAATYRMDRVHSSDTGFWTGEIPLPVPRGSEAMRLVIREYEQFVGDAPAEVSSANIAGHKRAPSGSAVVRRIVYADVLEI